MLTASEIVKEAFREGNMVALDATTGVPVTTPGQDTEGLALLNRFIDSLYGMELGEFSQDWPVPPMLTSPVPARYPIRPQNENVKSDQYLYPPGNVRLILKLTGDTTLYLPQSPDDGARVEIINIGGATGFNLTLDANGRTVRGSLTSTDTDVLWAGVRLLYRADLSDWKAVTALAAADNSPFPEFFDDFLSIGTFIRLAPRYGKSVTPELMQTYGALRKRLKAQYQQHSPRPSADPQPFRTPANLRGSAGNRGSLFS